MMAEIFGKDTGYCRGRGGSMHIAAFDVGSLGALAVVGSGIPLAVGAALGFQMRHEDRVAVPFMGDGGTNTGNFHEGLNMASVWKLPVVFVVENNQYAVSTRISEAAAIEDLSQRALSYGIPGVRVDGNDVLAVHQAAVEAIARARRGEGPTLLVTETYRIEGHYAGEPEVYRSKAEVEERRRNDPIQRFRSWLVEHAAASTSDLDAIDGAVKEEMAGALRFARASPAPDPATALDYIYAG
jgi:pyruvate dehydrogenase E1 component alpha subunit